MSEISDSILVARAKAKTAEETSDLSTDAEGRKSKKKTKQTNIGAPIEKKRKVLAAKQMPEHEYSEDSDTIETPPSSPPRISASFGHLRSASSVDQSM